MNVQDLILLLTILVIVSNAKLIQNYINNKIKNNIVEKFTEPMSNVDLNQSYKYNKYLMYVNTYKNIYHHPTLKNLFSSLHQVETNYNEPFANNQLILDNTYVISCIENYKPICSICVCNIKYLKEYLDSIGNTEALINPISNGYFVYQFLIHSKIDNKFEILQHYNYLLNEVYKWVSNPYSYYISNLHNNSLNRNTQNNILYQNLYFMNESIFRPNENNIKGYYILVFGYKLPDYIANKGDIINGNHKIHNKIANILFKDQFVLNWAKTSKLDNELHKLSDKTHTCSVNIGKKCVSNYSPNDLLKNGNIGSFGQFDTNFDVNNLYINDLPNKDIYKNVNELYPFEYCKSRYLKKNDYKETGYHFINNMTFYIKFIPRKINLYQSKQVSVSNYEPYNYS
jgi:hypothetical protein